MISFQMRGTSSVFDDCHNLPHAAHVYASSLFHCLPVGSNRGGRLKTSDEKPETCLSSICLLVDWSDSIGPHWVKTLLIRWKAVALSSICHGHSYSVLSVSHCRRSVHGRDVGWAKGEDADRTGWIQQGTRPGMLSQGKQVRSLPQKRKKRRIRLVASKNSS